jgi:lipopolysaccharide/colanic/teichoic acid biosynthesis glycosyltransferase
MAKRLLDILFALSVLAILSPLLVIVALLIYLQDFRAPFYVATRVGRQLRPFRMVKFRSMVINADRSGVTSTSATDRRITPVGSIVRRYKLDELPQFWNVLIGEMSVVGPRPNVPSGVAVYTPREMHLLDVRPGITDLASIVFSDEGEIISGKDDADAAYDQLIRPWKSRLGLVYVERRTLWTDLKLIWLTALAVLSRERALAGVGRILAKLDAPEELQVIARREHPLMPALPP